MSQRPVLLAPEAEEEAREAFLWYEARDLRVAQRFEVQLVAALDQLSEAL